MIETIRHRYDIKTTPISVDDFFLLVSVQPLRLLSQLEEEFT